MDRGRIPRGSIHRTYFLYARQSFDELQHMSNSRAVDRHPARAGLYLMKTRERNLFISVGHTLSSLSVVWYRAGRISTDPCLVMELYQLILVVLIQGLYLFSSYRDSISRAITLIATQPVQSSNKAFQSFKTAQYAGWRF